MGVLEDSSETIGVYSSLVVITMKQILLSICIALTSAGWLFGQPSGRLTADTVRGLELRTIMATLVSGRVSDIAVDPRNRSVWYLATAAGGLWKTSNRGRSWQPIFDEGGSYSLGCVTVDPTNPDIVWLGTGENQSQRSVGFGDGVYKSTDAGKTWKKMGLPNSEHIGKIIVDPRNSGVVWVASQGPLWAAGGDRGLYKTTDGGETWKPVLQIGENTGVTDIVLDPRNPDVIYAASYQRRRNTGLLVAGGPESAIYKSTDGGAKWTKLTNGLPPVDIGRIALAVSPQKPDVVYASVTTSQANKQGGWFRSEDGGANWIKMNDYMVTDPQYYGEIYADPHKVDRVYAVDVQIHVTEDGGKTFKTVPWGIHVDNHAIMFDPADANHLMVGNDGGLYESYDGGRVWEHFNNLPVTQYYRLAVDNALPFYHVYAGAQDNGSMGVPSRTVNRVGIRTSEIIVTGGGDGMQSLADPEDPNTVYSCSQNAACNRLDLRSGVSKSVRPRFGQEEDAKLHWRFDNPFLISPHSHTRLYIAGNRLARSDDRGDTWKLISPDLTRQIDRDKIPVMGKIWGPDAVWKNVFTDFYGTATKIDESPMKEGLLYVGTDDGLVQVSEDGGQNWRKIETFPGVPDLTYVTDVYASPTDANTVYATFADYQRGNFKPYVLKSTDRGKSWTSIAGNLPDRNPVWAVAQDQVNPNLLFAGTEFGLYFTVDGGRQWVQLKGGVPTIAFRDFAIQKRETDLVAASFGRGIFILDDYSALRRLTPETLSQDGVLFAPRKARLYDEIGYVRAEGNNVTSPNPPYGALLTYYLREDLAGAGGQNGPKIVLTVTDASGKMVRQIDASSKAGVHRTPWDLRATPPPAPAGAPGGRGGAGGQQQARRPAGGEGEQEAEAPQARRGRGGTAGPPVAAGTYKVTLGKLVNGTLTPLSEPQTLEVVPLETVNW